LSVKRAALADSKTGMPVFQPYQINPQPHPHSFQNFTQANAAASLHPQVQHLTLAQHPQSGPINYSAINFPMPYATYPATFTLPCKISLINNLFFNIIFKFFSYLFK
jgi:hypothetical protein